ncbi:MAG: FtsW/RodA/SpoVE family cell cycle protein [Oscillospiraceae bacterium]
MNKLNNGISYSMVSFFVVLTHIAMLSTVFAKGEYESLIPVFILSGIVIASDFFYFAVIKNFKQDTYTMDFFLVFILNMSVIFQSCFGEVSFNYKHFITTIVGFICCQIGFRISRNYALLESKKKFMYAGIAFLMVVILVFTGRRSIWIDFGFFSVQPSEFIKPLFAVVCATSLTAQQNKVKILGLNVVPDNIYLFITTVVIVALQWWCRDLGSLPTFCAAAGCAFILRICYPQAKFSKKKIIALCVAGVGVISAAIAFAPSYVKDRLSVDIWADKNGNGYQQCKALIAIAQGGWFGKGPAKGSLHKVAAYDTDIVFSSISEEWGFVMAIFAVMSVILMLCLVIINHPRSYYHSTLAVSICAMLVTQMALNIFGSCNMIPFTGVTVPFISNGGSSMVSCSFMIGMLKATQSPVYTLPPSKFMKKKKKKSGKKEEMKHEKS